MCDILVIGARGIPNVQGGLEKHAEMLFPQFADHAYSVTLLGLRRYVKSASYKGVRLVGLPSLGILKTDKLVYHVIALVYAALTRPKLVHLQGLNSALFLALYRLFGLKVVFRYGSSDYEYPKWGRVGRVVLRLCERQLPLANHVIAVSQHYKDMLVRKYALEAVSVVPNGVERFPESDDPDGVLAGYGLSQTPFVLAVGRITPEKDYHTLAGAARRLGRDDVALVIAGGSGDDAYARTFADIESDRIRLIGEVARPALATLYRRARLYVCSSVHEGQSNAVLEALAFAKPIVASDIPANRELALNEACYFPPGDAEALMRRVDRALKEPERFISRQAHLVGWDDVYRMTASVYRSVVPSLT